MDTTTIADAVRIGNYEFEKFIDIGGTSIVFRGVHWRLRESHGVHQYVALKLMWDLDVARDEMARLIDSDTVSEVCSLLDYFEVDYGEVAPVIEPFKPLLQARDEPCDFSLTHTFAVVVLQFMAGTPLVITEPYDPELCEPAETLSWFIRHDDRTWRQSLRWKLNRYERLRIIQQMVAAIKDSHRRVPPIVHGDLNPANVLYDRATGRVRLIDYGILGRGGVEGWNSPWHYALGQGRIDKLPPEADIFMMGHWVRRLLGNIDPAYTKLADQIANRKNGSTPHTAEDLQRKLRDIEAKIRSRRTNRLLVIAVAVVCCIWLAVLWRTGDNRSRLKTEETIQRYVALSNESEDGFRQAQSKLLEYLYEPGNEKYYDSIVAGLAEVNRIKGSHQLSFLAKIDFSKPAAVMVTNTERLLVFDQYPFFEGGYINRNEYILHFDWQGMTVSDGSHERKIEFSQHPMQIPSYIENYGVVWESDINDLFMAITSHNRTSFLNLTNVKATILGVFNVSSADQFIQQISSTVGVSWFDHEPLMINGLDHHHYAYWVFNKGMVIESTTLDQFIRVLVKDQLGYRLEKIPPELVQYRIADVIRQPAPWDTYLRKVLHSYGYDFDLVIKDRESWVQIYQKEGGG